MIPIKSIQRTEKAIYDQKKIYFWFTDGRGKSSRMDLETFDPAIAADIIARIHFLSKSIKCKIKLD